MNTLKFPVKAMLAAAALALMAGSVLAQEAAPDDATAQVDAAAHKTGQVVSDSWITSKVKSQLLADSTSRNSGITVTTTNGVVALAGTASSHSIVDHAKQIAAQVKGVNSVDTSGVKLQ